LVIRLTKLNKPFGMVNLPCITPEEHGVILEIAHIIHDFINDPMFHDFFIFIKTKRQVRFWKCGNLPVCKVSCSANFHAVITLLATQKLKVKPLSY
jgi:hypothetical protein